MPHAHPCTCSGDGVLCPRCKRRKYAQELARKRRAGIPPRGYTKPVQRRDGTLSVDPIGFFGKWPERVRLTLTPADIYGQRGTAGAEASATNQTTRGRRL